MNKLFITNIEKNMIFTAEKVYNLILADIINGKIKWIEDIIDVIYGLNIEGKFVYIPVNLKTRHYLFLGHDFYQGYFINIRHNLSSNKYIRLNLKRLIQE